MAGVAGYISADATMVLSVKGSPSYDDRPFGSHTLYPTKKQGGISPLVFLAGVAGHISADATMVLSVKGSPSYDDRTIGFYTLYPTKKQGGISPLVFLAGVAGFEPQKQNIKSLAKSLRFRDFFSPKISPKI